MLLQGPTSVEAIPSSLHVLASNDRRGAEVFGTDLAAELRTRGAVADVLALTQSAMEVHLPVRSLGDRLRPSSLRSLRRACDGFDVVVGHGSSSLPALALTSRGAPPFVYRSIGDPRHWSATGLRRVRSSVFLRRAAGIVVLWPVIADVIHQSSGVPHGRIHCIPNAVDSRSFPLVDDARRQAARAALRLPDAPVVAAIGALSWEKDLDVAVDAIGHLDDVVLLLAGDGPERGRIESHAQRVAPGRVRFLGAVDDPAAVLAAADAVVLSSRTEGLPGVLIEAGMSGLPVIATAVGGVREIVVDGETGVVVPPDDPAVLAGGIRAALESGPELGLAARARCLARFDLPTVVDQWSEVLRTVA